ncbi:MAG: L,D-transpeptidase [Chloroflexi bacterium]|nr:L,D-transpeptidase [Chloroflexota bacterium]
MMNRLSSKSPHGRAAWRLLMVCAILAAAALPARAAEAQEAPLGVCLPEIYREIPQTCLLAGPAAALTDLAAIGITFPRRPLPAAQIPAELGVVPYYYAKVNDGPAKIFASAEDAVRGKDAKRILEDGFNYVTYIDSLEIDGKRYYLIAPGEWMRRDQIQPNIVYSPFRGLEFSATPANAFGWILWPVQSQRAPGLNDVRLTGVWYAKQQVFQLYERVEQDGLAWYRIGPEEWVAARDTAVVFPNTAAPEGVTNGRWIDVDLEQQTVAVYEDNRLVFATLVSTGVPGWWTRPGLFKIEEKVETTYMTGAFEADRSDFYYLEDVPYTLYFDQARAFHGTYWHDYFGTEQSHGCANLSIADSHWLFNWAVLGDWVYVHDRSGQTPTDPSLYGEGGA